jgi:chaperone BCS1
MHWLSKQPAFGKSREFEITTRTVGRNSMEKTAGDIEEDEEDGEQFEHGTRHSYGGALAREFG